MAQTPPGWYPHPDGGLRWWNGLQWANPPFPETVAQERAGGVRELLEEPPAWTPFRPLPGAEGARKPPKPAHRGRNIALAVAGLVVASLIASEVQAYRDDEADLALEPVAAVVDPADGCKRFLAVMTGVLLDKTDNSEADRRIAQLRDAARANDGVLASDLQNLMDAGSSAEVSAVGQVIVRRCVAAGHLTTAEVQRLTAAGLEAAGVVPQATTPAVAPPPQALPVEESAAPVESPEVEERPAALAAGQPTCAQALAILEQHGADIHEWTERFGSVLVGSPWTPGDRVTVRGVSPDTGDPIRATFTATDGMLDDAWLDDEALNGDLPDSVEIYEEGGQLHCESP